MDAGISELDEITITKEEMDAYERECRAYVEAKVPKCEAKWRSKGTVFAWLDPEPTWEPYDFWNYCCLPEPQAPCNRTFRLRLIGGGQVRVTEKFEWCKSVIAAASAALERRRRLLGEAA